MFLPCLGGFPPWPYGLPRFWFTGEGDCSLSPVVGAVCSFPYSSPKSEDLGDWICSTAHFIEFFSLRMLGLN